MTALDSSPFVPLPDDAEAVRRLLSPRFDLTEKEIRVGSFTFRLLKVLDTNVLLERLDPKEFSRDERLPYWADVWISSVELARWCLEEGNLRGKRVLEIGCGLGLAGIAAAVAGAEVVLSDYEHDALQFAGYNACLNLHSAAERSRVQLLHLDWRRLPSLEPFDMIMGADIAYERKNFRSLIALMQSLVVPDGTVVLTDPDRSIGRAFFRLIEDEGFSLSSTERTHRWDGREMTVVCALVQRTAEQHR